MRDGQLLEKQEIDKMYDHYNDRTADLTPFLVAIYLLWLSKEDMMLSAL